MNRHQRRLLREAMGRQPITLPGPVLIWLLYALVVAGLVKYLLS